MENSQLSVGQTIDVISIINPKGDYDVLYPFGSTGIVLKYFKNHSAVAIIGHSSLEFTGWTVKSTDYKLVGRLHIKSLKH